MRRALETWLARPRRPLFDAVPGTKLVQALWALPYISAGVLVAHFLGAQEDVDGDLWLLAIFTVIAIVETVFLVLWMRRPVEKQDALQKRERPSG